MEPFNREHSKEISELDLSDAGLRTHPSMKRIPEAPEDSSRFLALCADLEENGIRLPIPITRKREIVDVDGRDRWLAAKRVQCPKIPVVYVRDEEVNTAILSSMLHRRHFTRSALAYLAFPLMTAAYEELRHRHVDRLKTGNRGPSSIQSTMVTTIEDFARNQGFGRDLFFQAKQVHEIFVRDAEYKADMEPRILAEPIGGEHEDRRPVGLGAVIAGWGGRDSTKDKAKGAHGQLELFTEGFGTFVRRFSYWAGFDERARRQARVQIRSEIAELKPEECGAMAEFMSTVAGELRDRAKEK